MKDVTPLQNGSKDRLAHWLALWFGSGLIRPAPGTWGSLAALPPAAALAWLFGWPGLLIGTAVLVPVGLWAIGRYMQAAGQHDPKEVVIDEVAGQWLALLPVATVWELYPAAFLLFRFFDIVKPWPASWADRSLAGPLGVMMDDLFAGGYSLIICLIITLLLG